jgi:hypothetical protein
MKSIACLPVVLSLTLSVASLGQACNVRFDLPIAAAMDASNVQDRPSGSVKLFFGNPTTPKIAAPARQLCRNAKDRIVSVVLKGELVKIADE